jgi:hypothetical protein
VKFPPLSRRRWISLLAATTFLGQLHSQNAFSSGNTGLNVSLCLAAGTHFQRIGVSIQFYYVNQGFQANTVVRCYFNVKAPGPDKRYGELVLSQGVLYAFGPMQDFNNPFFSSVSNQTGLPHSIAYAYNGWFNRIRTSQRTGIIALTYEGAGVTVENDILGAPSLDRFRTGAFLLRYQHRDIFQAAVNCAMWTGQFGRKKDIFLISKFYNNCYMDTVGGLYTNFSHGLLSGQIKVNVGYGHNVQANVGVDAEQIRDIMQNRIMHNMAFIPDKWQRTKNCHIPMLDENGHVFLYTEGQKVRKARLYWNLFSNANEFY